jgi:hypothetical protein
LKEKLKALREEEDEDIAPAGEAMRLIYKQIEKPNQEGNTAESTSPRLALDKIYKKIETANKQDDKSE